MTGTASAEAVPSPHRSREAGDLSATLATFKAGAARLEQPGGEIADGPDEVPSGKVSSLDLKWAAMRSMSMSWMRTRTCSAGRPMAVVLSAGLSPCSIARSLSGTPPPGQRWLVAAATGLRRGWCG